MKCKVFYFLFSIITISYFISSCKEKEPPKSEEYLKGEAIAKRLCSSCHVYTPPELLDQIAWPNVLSAMNAEMKKQGIEPAYKDWIATQRFYLTQAPKTFTSTSIAKPEIQNLFKARAIRNDSVYHSSSTLLATDLESRSIHVGQSNGMMATYQNNTLQAVWQFNNIPVDMSEDYILGMGSLGPSDDVNGELVSIKDENIEPIADWLNRPIHFQNVDLNKDGEDEFLISSFGSPTDAVMTGELNLIKLVDGQYDKIILDPTPGATMTKVFDLDQDGDLDIVALFGQGNETIKVYYNQGGLSFTSKTLIGFPPVYGTNSFDLADVNSDGHVDIVVTSGDNDDYSQIFKPYHGVRIFLNNGSNEFEEEFFYSINGASKVVCTDFDKDGDMDFVVLAMYPDLFSRPWESIQLFEHKSEMNFEPGYFEAEPADNWILLEVDDIDGDGDEDIICAANQRIHGMLPPAIQRKWKVSNVGLKVWENQIKN